MSESTDHRRPFLVTLLLVIFGVLALLGWVRLWQSISTWTLLSQSGGAWLPVYLTISGGVWGALGLPAVWGLWRKKAWVVKAVWVGALLYPVFFWFDRLFIARSPESRANLAFIAGVTLIWLALVFYTLSRRGTIAYLGQNNIINARP